MSKLLEFIKNIIPFNNRTEMPKVLYVIKVVLTFYFLKVGTEILSGVFTVLIHFPFGMNPLKGEVFTDPAIVEAMCIFGYLIMVSGALLYWKLIQKKTLAELGFTKNFGTYFIGIGAGVVIIGLAVGFGVLSGSVEYNGLFENANYPAIVLACGTYICQGAFEEILCRGVVLQLIKKKINVPVAIIVNTVLFILPHLSAMDEDAPVEVFVGIVNMTLLSVLFSLITIRLKSLWAACGIHAIWNYILYNIFGLALSGNDVQYSVFSMQNVGSNILNGGEFGIEASVITTGVLAAALGMCLALVIRNAKKSRICC